MAIIQKLVKAVQEVPIELQRFVQHQYPRFVTGGGFDTLEAEVPVFMFHTINRSTFQSQLEFLKRNGYRTLDLATFMAFLRGEKSLEAPSVLLTFDDGDKSWYDIAYPLLKQYGLHAVGFVVPHYIQEQPTTATASKGWLSWPELIELDHSGVIEIESHSQYHARIFTAAKLVDFFNPQLPDTLGLDVPWIGSNGSYTNQLPWGTPIYQYGPRLEGHLRYLADAEVQAACTDWVQAQGGVSFFEKSTWRRELTQYHQTLPLTQAQYETEQERQQQMLEDLAQSKEVLSHRLGKSIEHLCYPWGAGSLEAIDLSQQVGYQSNFWVSLGDRNTNRGRGFSFLHSPLKG
ncbi:MAG: polysaccharide deacetylase family protein [Oscillatoriales cyanobacterium SM2_3_0]|nr:polysaccharide deacetylase family protein [Oscillatoriales cyanobacterium SM2_3_0]